MGRFTFWESFSFPAACTDTIPLHSVTLRHVVTDVFPRCREFPVLTGVVLHLAWEGRQIVPCHTSLVWEFVFGSGVFRDLMLIVNVNAGLLLLKCFIQLKASILGPLFSSPFPSIFFPKSFPKVILEYCAVCVSLVADTFPSHHLCVHLMSSATPSNLTVV